MAGRESNGHTDDRGWVRFDGLAEGSIIVTSKLEGPLRSNTLGYLSLAEKRPGSVTTDGPLDENSSENGDAGSAHKTRVGTQTIALVGERKVQTGDTLDGIASDAHLDSSELALFNWGSAEQKEIDKGLRTRVGSHRKDKSSGHYQLHSKDDPGIIYVPGDWQKSGLLTRRTYTIEVCEPTGFDLHVWLEVDPKKMETWDDTFTLLGGESPESPSYRQRKTTLQDNVQEDDYLELVYTGLSPDLSYWLEVDQGEGGQCYYAFEGLSWDDLRDAVRS